MENPQRTVGPAGLGFENVSKSFGPTSVLTDICLDIPTGSYTTLLGPSGSGKSTLLRMAAGFEPPNSGRVLLKGRDITALSPNRRNIGMVFQNYALFPHLTVAENVRYPLRMRRVGRKKSEHAMHDFLDRVQMSQFLNRYPSELSGGQQQRVALARALVYQPRVLLLDEPMGALDKRLRIEIQAVLRTLHRDTGISFVHVTHDQEEAFSLATNVVVLRDGIINQEGPPESIFDDPRNAFVASFIGNFNIIDVTVLESTSEGVSVRFCDGSTVAIPRPAVKQSTTPGSPYRALLRVSDGDVSRRREGHAEGGMIAGGGSLTLGAGGVLSLDAVVQDVFYLGGRFELICSSTVGTVRCRSDAPIPIAAEVKLRWKIASLSVVPQGYEN